MGVSWISVLYLYLLLGLLWCKGEMYCLSMLCPWLEYCYPGDIVPGLLGLCYSL